MRFPIRLALPALVLALAACQPEAALDEAVEAIEHTSQAAPPMEREQAGAPSATRFAAQTTLPADRELIRTGAIRLRADDHGRAVSRARALAVGTGGFVGDEASQRYADRVETTLTIRVPAAEFDTLYAALSALPGEVESRSVRVEDVTRQVADVEARLGARRAAEAQFLELLDDADSVEDVLAVQVELQRVREEIEAAEAQLRAVRDEVALSTVRLTVFEASAAGVTAGPGYVARVGRALVVGWEGLLEGLLVLLAVWPLVLLVAVGLAVALARRRRRRAPTFGPSDAEFSG